MKKLLLSGAFLLGSYLTASAQDTCDTAIEITSNGEQTSAAVTGAYGNTCWGGTTASNGTTPLKANWYSYTPSANGMLMITSDVASNPASTDTRLSVFTGACGALECYNGNDDINGAATGGNYRSELNIPVEAGVTYYIAWDSYWSAAAFNFEVTFSPTDCLSPNSLGINDATNVTTTSAMLSWEAGIGNPTGYQVEWGAVDFEQGTGTTVNTNTNSVTLMDLPESSTVWYYVRANCGITQGEWVGPYELKLAVSAPYTFNFDTDGDNADGFVFDGWGLSTSATNAALANTGTAFIFTNVGATASDAFAFFRPMELSANEQVTITFQTLTLPAAATGNLEVTVGNMADADAQTTVVESIPLTGAAASAANYEMQTVNWTAPASGIYYFAFHNNTGVSSTGNILVDSVNVTSILGTNDNIATQMAIYPNPATSVINISNADNILVKGIQITDLNGRIVKSAKFDGVTEAQVNVSDLANGMYLMTVSSDKGSMTKKIVKN